MLKGEKKWGAFFASEVFCLPSHQENFGIVVAEALACGKPVLISNKVNIWREVAVDGAGFVHDDTVEGTAFGFQKWLNLIPTEREAMQLAARNCFETRFRIDRVTESFIATLEKHVAVNIDAGTPEVGAVN